MFRHFFQVLGIVQLLHRSCELIDWSFLQGISDKFVAPWLQLKIVPSKFNVIIAWLVLLKIAWYSSLRLVIVISFCEIFLRFLYRNKELTGNNGVLIHFPKKITFKVVFVQFDLRDPVKSISCCFSHLIDNSADFIRELLYDVVINTCLSCFKTFTFLRFIVYSGSSSFFLHWSWVQRYYLKTRLSFSFVVKNLEFPENWVRIFLNYSQLNAHLTQW